ncbi:MAG: asparagine synthase (glutamine-hydrolyzing) [Desulfobacterales bacterium]|nr:asparagine synthase (glutamine-hydrolyzing) [Desulfobacterales bacterium]
MCGICGIYNYNKDVAVHKSEIAAMCRSMFHRGPDDQGIYTQGAIGLGMRRLSIIDVAGGKQPIANEDESIWIVLNGEIYNYLELREFLVKKGHRFKTNSDTESILHLYEEKGMGFVDDLRGMFAAAIWDNKQRKLIIVRDHLGIKPLFYAMYNGKLVFASEMKAILQDKQFPRGMDDHALAAFFTLSYIPAPLTIYKNIRKLMPGHFLTVADGNLKIEKYWDVEFKPDRSKKENDFIEESMSILHQSVDMQLMSEVPLGAFLSGGIDSGVIVALMSLNGSSRVNTFTIGFGGETGGYLDERKYAQMVAKKYSTNHREYEVSPSPAGIIEKIVSAFDEPFADDSAIPSYYVCKMAKENVTVALSGLGGDEAFAGYERYLGFKLRSMYLRVPLFFRNQFISRIIAKLPERSDGHYTINHMKRFTRSAGLPADLCYLGFISMMTNSLGFYSDSERFLNPVLSVQDLLRSYFNAPNCSNDLDRAFYCDIKTYLPEDILAVTDRMSMHHSLEVRVPFLDHKLIELSATIPPEMKLKRLQKKYLLKKAAGNLLPRDVIRHRKQGFSVPMARWLQTDIKQYVMETLSENELNKHGLFNRKNIVKILDEHFTQKEIHDKLIWSLVIFQTWFKMYAQGNDKP